MESEQNVSPAESLEARRESLGRRIKAMRQKAEMTIPQLSARTRVSEEYLLALENGHFIELPSMVFVQGYVQCICRVLDLDHELFRAEIKSCLENSQQQAGLRGLELDGMGEKRKTIWNSGLSLVSGVVVILLLSVGGFFLLSSEDSTEPTDTVTDGTPISEEPETAGIQPTGEVESDRELDEEAQTKVEAPVSGPDADDFLAEARTTGKKGLVSISMTQAQELTFRIDGTREQRKRFEAGDHTFDFDGELEVEFGSFEGVEIKFNDRQFGSLNQAGLPKILSFKAGQDLGLDKKTF